jgi:hypothetical protein
LAAAEVRTFARVGLPGDGETQEHGHHRDEYRQHGVFTAQEGHGTIVDLVCQVLHDVGAGRLLLDVAVDPGGRAKTQHAEQPRPVGKDDEIHGLKDPRLVQVVEERAIPASSALAGY